jgi:hypothetical protein
MEITPILNFISIIQGLPQEVTKSTKDSHKANAIKYIPVSNNMLFPEKLHITVTM